MRGIYTARRSATALESWRSSLEAMSIDELDALLTDEEKAQWFRAIAGRLQGNRTPVGQVLADEELRELLAAVLAETRRASA